MHAYMDRDVQSFMAGGNQDGDLTVAGVEKSNAEIQGKKTPEGAAEGAMKKAS